MPKKWTNLVDITKVRRYSQTTFKKRIEMNCVDGGRKVFALKKNC